MKFIYYFMTLLLFLNSGCNENNNEQTTNSYSIEAEDSFTILTTDIVQLNNSQECWELGIATASASTEDYKQKGQETSDGIIINDVTYKIFEGQNGLFEKIDCPVEEPIEEPSQIVDCYSLSFDECLDYQECELWQTGKRFTFNFNKENFCIDRIPSEVLTISCATKDDCLTNDDDPNSISQYNDIMKNSKTGDLILVNRDDCRTNLPNSLDQGIGDWEMDLTTFSEMLVYYQNLSMEDSTIYTFPKDCE